MNTCKQMCLQFLTVILSWSLVWGGVVGDHPAFSSTRLANRELRGERPPAQDYHVLADQLTRWASQARASGRLAEAEAVMLANSHRFIRGQPDANHLYRSLHRRGYAGDRQEMEQALTESSPQRQALLVNLVRQHGLYQFTLMVAESLRQMKTDKVGFDSTGHALLLPTRLNLINWRNCGEWTNWGADLLTLAAIAAFIGQEEVAAVFGGVGAVFWGYGRYLC